MNNSVLAFKDQLKNVSDWAQKRKVDHVYNGGVGCFEDMPYEQQVLAATGLARYFDFILSTETEREEVDYANTSEFLKAALRQLDWKLPPGIIERVVPQDYVEIYMLDLVPAFKSLNFWGNCSYSLDELYTFPYSELFARDEFYQASLNRVAEKIFKKEKIVMENPVPEHVAWEVRGPQKRKISYKLGTAVYDSDGSLVGIMIVSDIKPLSN